MSLFTSLNLKRYPEKPGMLCLRPCISPKTLFGNKFPTAKIDLTFKGLNLRIVAKSQ